MDELERHSHSTPEGPRNQHNSGKNRQADFSSRHLLVGAAAGAIVVLIIVGLALAIHKPSARLANFPSSVKSQISGFRFYYYGAGPVAGFTLKPSSVSYLNGVLLFEIDNSSGKTLAFTEEAIPPNFDTSPLTADKQYTDEYGHAYISDLVDRTTGALFTSDGTWVLVNAPAPVGAATMQKVLDSLRPQ